MGNDIVKIKHEGNTVFSSENERFRKALMNELMDSDATITSSIFPEKDSTDKCVKITMDDLHIVQLINNTFMLWLHKGMDIYIKR